ncbi:MAG: polysaccharide deacetylase family protein [Nanoarchaeota archaeon]
MKLRNEKLTLEIVAVILVFSIFSIVLLGYYSTALLGENVNPRFVKGDYEKLRAEAEKIGNPSASINETAKSVFVLTYHIVSKDEPKDDYEISYNQFKDNMFALKRLGFQTVKLEDLYPFLNGEKELPDKSFLITFDDGAKASFYNTDQILEVLNYTAVMFVITGNSFTENQSAYYLNETELIAVQKTGRWELESHTHESHFKVPIEGSIEYGPALTNKLWISEENRFETNQEFFTRVSTDLEKAKMLLETKLNKEVTSFALPYGDFGDKNNYAEAHSIIENLTTSMHKMVFYQFPMKDRLYKGNYAGENQDSYLVTRFASDSFRIPDELLERIEGSRTVELPYNENYLNYDRWPRISGQASFRNESMILTPLEDSIFTYLDGSYLWEDYDFSIRLDNDGASSVSLMSRLTPFNDYVSCQYNDSRLSLVTLNEDIHKKLVSVNMPENITLQIGTYLSMSVSGSSVKCFVNGYEMINSEVQNMSPNGGVGVKAEKFVDADKNFIFKDISIVGRESNGI